MAIEPGTRMRLGGLVADGSVERDDRRQRAVRGDRYGDDDRGRSTTSILPDLFREGQGIVAEGVLTTAGLFTPTNVLAKHDENYMPREVADALRRAGRLAGRRGGAQ